MSLKIPGKISPGTFRSVPFTCGKIRGTKNGVLVTFNDLQGVKMSLKVCLGKNLVVPQFSD